MAGGEPLSTYNGQQFLLSSLDRMVTKRIGLPGLGGRLRAARNGAGLTQEAVAESIGVSWMTVHRWEYDQRTISEDKLNRLCQLYGKTLRWFLTLGERDLDLSGEDDDVAWRIYQRVSGATQEHQTMLERIVAQTLEELEASASEGAGSS